jgi:hypothetical protein
MTLEGFVSIFKLLKFLAIYLVFNEKIDNFENLNCLHKILVRFVLKLSFIQIELFIEAVYQ